MVSRDFAYCYSNSLFRLPKENRWDPEAVNKDFYCRLGRARAGILADESRRTPEFG